MDLVIRRDGVWVHEGTPIGRPELVRLFASILKRDGAEYVLVTPVEKLTILVEDLPFQAVLADRLGDDVFLTTDVGDIVRLGPDHVVVVDTHANGEPAPRVHIRHDLWARVTRSAFYDLVSWSVVRHNHCVLPTSGGDFDLGPAT
jgi:hypothetical protein